MPGTGPTGPLEDPANQPENHDDVEQAGRFLGEATSHPRAGGPPPQPRPEPTESNVLHDAFDARLYAELSGASEELASLPSHPAAPPTFPALLADLFFVFYKVKPALADPVDVWRANRSVNRPFLERLLEDERTLIVRISTCLDDMASALATLEAAKRILQELAARPDLAKWAEENSKDGPDDDKPDDSTDVGATSPPARDLRRTISGALDAAGSEAEGFWEAADAWGLSPGDLKKVPLGERLEIARNLKSPRMASFTSLLGRMRNVSVGSVKNKRRAPGGGELHSITRGSNLARVLPYELARGLASGRQKGDDARARTLELDFHRRRAEGGLLSYRFADDASRDRGAIVAMIDASPSMAGAPMDWATALAASLAQGPAAAGRPVYLIYFNTLIVEEIDLIPGERDPRKLLRAATVGTSGGTDYDAPMRRALTIVEENEDHREADLLIATDGQCSLSAEGRALLALKKEALSFSLYAVLCGDHADASDLTEYCEAIWHAEKDLASPTGGGNRLAGDVLRNIS